MRHCQQHATIADIGSKVNHNACVCWVWDIQMHLRLVSHLTGFCRLPCKRRRIHGIGTKSNCENSRVSVKCAQTTVTTGVYYNGQRKSKCDQWLLAFCWKILISRFFDGHRQLNIPVKPIPRESYISRVVPASFSDAKLALRYRESERLCLP